MKNLKGGNPNYQNYLSTIRIFKFYIICAEFCKLFFYICLALLWFFSSNFSSKIFNSQFVYPCMHQTYQTVLV
jgi:hypothetical protein